ncbi:MAG: hypothetical protein IKN46_05150 [Acholeplasmatales bacterium]|nr:hypothetical protein [Acholeplasmatales bacterium]
MEDKDLQKDEAEVVESKDEATKAEEEPKNEIAKVEETKEEKEETKAEEPMTEKKAYDKDNLTRSIILAAVVLILQTSHWILSATPLHGNLPWFIINLVFVAAGVVITIFAALFFFKVTKDKLKEDIPSFCVSLAAAVFGLLSTVGWSVDMLRNLIGFFQEL